MKARNDVSSGRGYGGEAMSKQPRVSESTRAVAILRPLEPTTRQLAVLDAFAETGTYELASVATGISPATVRNLLIEIREHYRAATTIQAYRAALAAGDLSTLGCRCLTVR
jgi:hypothetical protein